MKSKFIQEYYIYVGIIIIFVALTVLLALVFKRQVNWERVNTNMVRPSTIEWVRINEKKLNMCLRGFELALAIIVLAFLLLPLMDIPNLLGNDYRITSGLIAEVKYSDGKEKVRFEDDDAWYKLNSNQYDIGDAVKICYLPFSRQSIVIEANGKTVFENFCEDNLDGQ